MVSSSLRYLASMVRSHDLKPILGTYLGREGGRAERRMAGEMRAGGRVVGGREDGSVVEGQVDGGSKTRGGKHNGQREEMNWCQDSTLLNLHLHLLPLGELTGRQ